MHNLLKMDKYQLIRNRLYWAGIIGVFLLGFFTAETYVPEFLGPGGGAAASLTDIFDGMIYDSTFILVLVSCLLAVTLGQEFSSRTIDQEIAAGHSRLKIFFSKLIVYLTAFNIMALVFPIAGCIREWKRFGMPNLQDFLYHFLKAGGYSFLLNSVMLMIPIFCCYFFRNKTKAVAVTAFLLFVSSLYLGYGMKFGYPIAFLPTYQIRAVVSTQAFFMPVSILVACIGGVLSIAGTWSVFHKCDLK